LKIIFHYNNYIKSLAEEKQMNCCMSRHTSHLGK